MHPTHLTPTLLLSLSLSLSLPFLVSAGFDILACQQKCSLVHSGSHCLYPYFVDAATQATYQCFAPGGDRLDAGLVDNAITGVVRDGGLSADGKQLGKGGIWQGAAALASPDGTKYPPTIGALVQNFADVDTPAMFTEALVRETMFKGLKEKCGEFGGGKVAFTWDCEDSGKFVQAMVYRQ